MSRVVASEKIDWGSGKSVSVGHKKGTPLGVPFCVWIQADGSAFHGFTLVAQIPVADARTAAALLRFTEGAFVTILDTRA